MADGGESDGVVLGDVGGTNVRFAIVRGGVLGPIAHLGVADYEQFADALAAFLADQAERTAIRGALFGAAGVVEDGRCVLTNNAWIIDTAELRARFGFADVHIVNDFEAVAWSLPRFAARDLRPIGGGSPKPGAPMVVLGPGTGLGVAAYVPAGRGGLVVRSQGGHCTLAGGSAREDALIERLRQQFGHVSAERALSGNGLENLYRVIASLDGLQVPERSAAEITAAGLGGTCKVSRAAVDLFCGFLGAFAGNMALTFAAEGGVFIAGGIAGHLRDVLPASEFRARFQAKGRMSAYLASIPTHLIMHDDPAFVGLQSLAAELAKTR